MSQPLVPLPDDVVADLDDLRPSRRHRRGLGGARRVPDTEAVFAENRDTVVVAIREMVGRRMAEHFVAESAFPCVTDCDRLTEAFAQLEARGVLAREAVGYTMGDVRSDMWELVDSARSQGHEPRGWAAFHRQNVERVVMATGRQSGPGRRSSGPRVGTVSG